MKSKLAAIITGDIVGSRNSDALIWLKKLKSILNKYGRSPRNWEIFRGDMFQLEVKVQDALIISLKIKAEIKQIKNLDVRIAIGIGTQKFKTNKITESNGEAYTSSGICFENLKKRRLAIKSPWVSFDKEWNLKLRLLSMTIDNWTTITSTIITVALENKKLNQNALAKKLNRSQSTISESLKRAGHEEIKLLLEYYNDEINKLI